MSDAADQPSSGPRPGKRERLIDAAARRLHEHGVCGTTIADIAREAEVPAGNVYYYFKTRDQIVEAVIEAQNERTRRGLEAHGRRAPPLPG